jgi:thioredoxin reductase (NADPH)
MVEKLIIIGSGPAGYSAAIYAARASLKPLLFSGDQFGGQLMFTSQVENYPGHVQGIMGSKLMMEMRQQAEKFGTVFIDKKIDKVDFNNRPFRAHVGDNEYQAESIIIATGAEAITLGLANEKKLLGKGISTCAVCDAAFYGDKKVYVVGGGDSAIEDTMALTKFTSRINIVVRRDQLRASQIMQQKVLNNPKVKIWWNSEVVEIMGEQNVERLKLKNNKTQHENTVEANGLFLAIGHRPNTDMFINKINLDNKGYILTTLNGLEKYGKTQDVWLNNYPTMTSIEGVFAAGDVVDFRYKQAITAAAMGTMTALDVEKWLL